MAELTKLESKLGEVLQPCSRSGWPATGPAYGSATSELRVRDRGP
jgi:hypothetical protein